MAVVWPAAFLARRWLADPTVGSLLLLAAFGAASAALVAVTVLTRHDRIAVMNRVRRAFKPV
jgi:hypothetical protein